MDWTRRGWIRLVCTGMGWNALDCTRLDLAALGWTGLHWADWTLYLDHLVAMLGNRWDIFGSLGILYCICGSNQSKAQEMQSEIVVSLICMQAMVGIVRHPSTPCVDPCNLAKESIQIKCVTPTTCTTLHKLKEAETNLVWYICYPPLLIFTEIGKGHRVFCCILLAVVALSCCGESHIRYIRRAVLILPRKAVKGKSSQAYPCCSWGKG